MGWRYLQRCIPALFPLLCACTTHYTHPLFTSDSPPDTFEPYIRKLSSDRVVGVSCSSWILFFPVTSIQSQQRAIDDALSKVPGTEALIDVSVDSDAEPFTFFYDRVCIHASGIPVAFK